LTSTTEQPEAEAEATGTDHVKPQLAKLFLSLLRGFHVYSTEVERIGEPLPDPARTEKHFNATYWYSIIISRSPDLIIYTEDIQDIISEFSLFKKSLAS
jgi:hypothetical protein